MISFLELTEDKGGKNLHLEHLEDEILNYGVDGGRAALNFLRSLRDMLSGSSRSSVNMTVKWDGAPAIFAGVEPETCNDLHGCFSRCAGYFDCLSNRLWDSGLGFATAVEFPLYLGLCCFGSNLFRLRGRNFPLGHRQRAS